MARLVKTVRKLVDSTSGEPELRQNLEREIEVLENKEPKFSGLREAYAERAESIRNLVGEIKDLPEAGTDFYQTRSEMLYNEILLLEKWEMHDVIPPTRDILPGEDAENIGNLARKDEKAMERGTAVSPGGHSMPTGLFWV